MKFIRIPLSERDTEALAKIARFTEKGRAETIRYLIELAAAQIEAGCKIELTRGILYFCKSGGGHG